MTYDAAGNQTYDCVGTHYYDAENRMTKAVQGSSNNYYFYDGNGKRVRRILNGSQTWGGQETWFVYGFDGELAAEYAYNQVTAPLATAPQKEYGYRGGKLLVVWDGTQTGDDQLKWLVTDHLGSTRMEANRSGSLASIRRHDYLPFGEELVASTGAQRSQLGNVYEPPPTNVRQRFTGYERDNETGLDFAEARYFANGQGRFTSADPIFFQKEMLTDPQRYNLYAYARNNPLKFVDPKGEAIEMIGDEEKRKKILEALRVAVGKQAGAYLYENKITGKDGKTRYFVGVYQNGPDGKGPNFQATNKVSQAVGRIIDDTRVATVELVEPRTKVTDSAGVSSVRIGQLPTFTPAAKDASIGRVVALDPKYDYGSLPGSVMSNGSDNKIDFATSLVHELGHLSFTWGLATGPSRDTAVSMENDVRRLRDPNGPNRIRHNPGDPKIGESPMQIPCSACKIR